MSAVPGRGAGAARGLATIAALALSLIVGAPVAGASSPAVPYSDPHAVGYIGLCNAAGQQITSGSVSTTPFVVRAVSSKPALAPYNAPGRTATLYGFQPRQELPPAAWSGEVMTAAGRYTNPAHPMTAATARDDSLADLLQDYPLSWDDLVQLRIYLGAPDEPIDSVTYPALNLKVSGQTWKVVGASGKVNCKAGSSTSVETLLLPASQLRPSPVAATGTAGHSQGATSAAGVEPVAATQGSGSTSLRATSASKHSQVSVVEVLTVLVLAVGLAGAVSFGVRQRRDRTFLHRHFSGSQS